MKNRLYNKAVGTIALLAVPIVTAADFTDVAATNMHINAITKLNAEGIMTGHDNGMFKPNDGINRAELTKIVVESQFSAEEIASCNVSALAFSDVRSSDWFAKYVCTANENTIIGGYPDGTFKPGDVVNYAEAAKIVVMAIRPDVFAATSVMAGSPWYTAYIASVNTLNAQPTNTIMPADLLKRAEAAELIYRMKFVEENRAPNANENSMNMQNEVGIEVGGAMMLPAVDIVDNASKANNVTTLVTAVQAADLVDTLKSEGPFTVFAPIDSAFSALPEGTLETLLMTENKSELRAILTYHVVAGKYTSADLRDGMQLTTVQGDTITISYDGTTWMVNDATILIPDIISSNGVTFAIDTVLMPESDRMSGEMNAIGEYTAYTEGVIGNGQESVLFFHAEWCPKCRANDANLTAWYAANMYDRNVYKVDYDTNTDLRVRYGVNSQDTFVVLDGEGNAVQKTTFPSETDLMAIIK